MKNVQCNHVLLLMGLSLHAQVKRRRKTRRHAANHAWPIQPKRPDQFKPARRVEMNLPRTLLILVLYDEKRHRKVKEDVGWSTFFESSSRQSDLCRKPCPWRTKAVVTFITQAYGQMCSRYQKGDYLMVQFWPQRWRTLNTGLARASLKVLVRVTDRSHGSYRQEETVNFWTLQCVSISAKQKQKVRRDSPLPHSGQQMTGNHMNRCTHLWIVDQKVADRKGFYFDMNDIIARKYEQWSGSSSPLFRRCCAPLYILVRSSMHRRYRRLENYTRMCLKSIQSEAFEDVNRESWWNNKIPYESDSHCFLTNNSIVRSLRTR